MSAKDKEHLKPIKSLGQNFLQDRNIQLKIVAALNIGDEDDVMEIGPGEGAITEHLVELQPNSLTIVEKDRRSAELIKRKYESEKVKVFEADILEWKGYDIERKVVGNLPYYITSQILFRMIENLKYVPLAVFMVQKEVADRLLAKPGGKDYGKLTVLLSTFFTISKVTDVSPNCFYPKPRVWSTVIKLEKRQSRDSLDIDRYWKVVKFAFSQRRKKLSNTLKPIKEIVESDKFSQFADKRAEALTVEDYIKLYEILEGEDGKE